MTEILDFLVENYIYVAAISAFFIIALIGFLIKGKRKNKKNESEENIPLVEINTPVVEKTVTVTESIKTPIVTGQPNSNGFLNEPVQNVTESIKTPIVIEQPNSNGFLNEPVQNVTESIKTPIVIEQPNSNGFLNESVKHVEIQDNGQNMFRVEPAVETFQVKLDNQPNIQPTNDIFLNDIPRNVNTYENKNVPEVFDVDENIVLDREKLDEEVDIIDFSDLNNFESNEDFPKPQNDINNI